MSQQSPKNNGNKPLGFGDLAHTAFGITVTYNADSPFAIKIEPESSMNNPFQIALSKRPLVPSLFQVAARADDIEPEPAMKDSRPGHARLAERMLNPRKLEAILNAIGKRKKAVGR